MMYVVCCVLHVMFSLSQQKECVQVVGNSSIFTRTMLVSAGISCHGVSVCLSQVDVVLKRLNVGSCTQRHTRASFLLLIISIKLKRGHPNGGTKCRWGRLNAGAVAAHWWLSTCSIINLVRS